MPTLCLRRGVLVNAEGFLPSESFDHQFRSLEVSVGCNRLWCDACAIAVKQRVGFDARRKARRVVKTLYASDDWQAWLDDGTLEKNRFARLYYCTCGFQVVFKETDLAGDPEMNVDPSVWHCAGHPSAKLPLDEGGGVFVMERSDWKKLLTDYWQGRYSGIPKIALWKTDYANRLYRVLPATASSALSAAAWQLIESDDATVAVDAATFFAMNPETLDPQAMLTLFATRRDALMRVHNPRTPSEPLRFWVLQALASRLRQGVEAPLLDLAQREVLSSDLVPLTLLGALEEVAPEWLAAHRTELVARYPTV